MTAADPPAILLLFDIGPMEFMVVIGAAIMLFGGDLPDMARKAGRTVRKLRTMASDVAKNLDVPQGMAKLPGAAEFKEELNLEGDLDLAQEADLDWREIAALPVETPHGSTAGRAAPAAPALTPAPASSAAPAPAPATQPPGGGEARRQ